MKALPIVFALAGIAAMALLVAHFGAGAVWHALTAVGAVGFVAVCAIQLVLIAAMGIAWRALLPGAGIGTAIWGRLVRDAGSEVLPLSQLGGYLLGARAMTLAGISGTLAIASTMVDLTLEFAAQLAYTAIGLAWLVRLQPDTEATVPVLLGLAVAGLAAMSFVLLQRRGFRWAERIAGFIGRGWAERGAAGAAALHSALADIYRRPSGLWLNFLIHLGCWIASTAEVWLALRLIGEPLPFGAVLAIESLLYAIRATAFFVPQAVGVQEGAYLLLGASFGLSPEVSLALSLLKRGRDIAIGLPALAAWQALEGNRLWRRRSSVAMPAAEAAPSRRRLTRY